MPGNFQVTRLRVSYIAAYIHDGLHEIGEAVAFAQRLANPQPVRGLPISLPFGDGLQVDTEFWSLITEMPEIALRAQITEEMARKFRRAGVPLRYRGSLAMVEDKDGVEPPRLEAHLHPFGVAVMATVDLTWPEPIAMEDHGEVTQRVRELGDMSAVMSVAGRETETKFGRAAAMAAAQLVGLLTTDGQGAAWEISAHRLATVISGTVSEPLKAMPTAQSPLHLALHWLSADDKVIGVPPPASAFVAQWDGRGYSWPPGSLVYMLKSGTSALSSEAAVAKRTGIEPRTADRHRLLLLQLAYIIAFSGLIHAAQARTSPLLVEWAKTAAKHLGRLYGPAELYAIWGLVPRSLMLRTDVGADIEHILGAGLDVRENYPVSEYG